MTSSQRIFIQPLVFYNQSWSDVNRSLGVISEIKMRILSATKFSTVCLIHIFWNNIQKTDQVGGWTPFNQSMPNISTTQTQNNVERVPTGFHYYAHYKKHLQFINENFLETQTSKFCSRQSDQYHLPSNSIAPNWQILNCFGASKLSS